MISNKEKMNVITEASLPQTSSIVAQVMQGLNSTESGTIRKKEFTKALLTFNNENQAELDVDSIVNEVFKDKVSLDRSVIMTNMNENLEIQDTLAEEPLVNDVLEQLKSSASGQITKSEVTRAIRDAALKNQVELTNPEVGGVVESLFNQGDFNRVRIFTRS
jgi:hypothetical protein